MSRRVALLLSRGLLGAALGCGSLTATSCAEQSSEPAPRAAELRDLVLTKLSPASLLPGSTLDVRGSFPGVVEELSLELIGTLGSEELVLRLPLTRSEQVGALLAAWPESVPQGNGSLLARVTGVDAVDGRPHVSERVAWLVESSAALTPELDAEVTELAFVNDVIELTGRNFLLGSGEGASWVVLSGCFTPQGATGCAPVGEQRLAADYKLLASAEPDRRRLGFAFAPRIAGIEPGTFTGSLRVENQHSSGQMLSSAERELNLELLAPRVFGLSPSGGSLGQRIRVSGGGFVAQSAEDATPAATRILISGAFTPSGGPDIPISFEVVPGFVSGNELLYVLNEEDALGTSANLRTTTGVLRGTAAPVVSYGGAEITGAAEAVELALQPVKQVVYVRFLPSYVESLRHFGLRAVDSAIRQRALAITAEIYRGVNVDLRESEPIDFGIYTLVEVGGVDPNGLGLLGYDNTPGKDVGNLRLDDRVGGVNSLTQENGDPGYGGVFVESLFGFSQHPGKLATQLSAADSAFDELFDVFRPDVGDQPVLATESEVAAIDAAACPSQGARPEQIACAVRALGSLIGDTLAHELGHALGLAEPEGAAFHNPSDGPGRLMDGGSDRDFKERAALPGAARVVFCRENYAYLRRVLPSAEPDPEAARPSCE